jgi:hypothetical protein
MQILSDVSFSLWVVALLSSLLIMCALSQYFHLDANWIYSKPHHAAWQGLIVWQEQTYIRLSFLMPHWPTWKHNMPYVICWLATPVCRYNVTCYVLVLYNHASQYPRLGACLYDVLHVMCWHYARRTWSKALRVRGYLEAPLDATGTGNARTHIQCRMSCAGMRYMQRGVIMRANICSISLQYKFFQLFWFWLW